MSTRSARHRTQNLWICSQELWPLGHRGGPLFKDRTINELEVISKKRVCVLFRSTVLSNEETWVKPRRIWIIIACFGAEIWTRDLWNANHSVDMTAAPSFLTVALLFFVNEFCLREWLIYIARIFQNLPNNACKGWNDVIIRNFLSMSVAVSQCWSRNALSFWCALRLPVAKACSVRRFVRVRIPRILENNVTRRRRNKKL
jgi:hypothetical protein